MSTWNPGAITYKQWRQTERYLYAIKDIIQEQTRIISEDTKNIVASNEQIASSLEDGFKRIAQINERGFDQVTSAVEAMHSDLNYNFWTLIRKVEYQCELLENILNVLITPFQTQVKELYRIGCDQMRLGNLNEAIDYFNRSLALPAGDVFFLSYYKLGQLYLWSRPDPEKANEYLLKAIRYGTGPVLADCNFFISQSYYYQLTGKKDFLDNRLLSNAIMYCHSAVSRNPKLSQGYYHLAKYYSYEDDVDKSMSNLQKAIEIDRNYSIWVWEDKVFEKNKEEITELLARLTEIKRKAVEPELIKAKSLISQFEQKNISQSIAFLGEFQKLERIVQLAEKDFQTKTYFGFDDCQEKLNTL